MSLRLLRTASDQQQVGITFCCVVLVLWNLRLLSPQLLGSTHLEVDEQTQTGESVMMSWSWRQVVF